MRLLRGVLFAATAASIGYQVAAVWAARRWRRRAPMAEAETDALLPVSILKPVRGLEPHAEESFASFCVQDHPDYELLFGVADPEDPAAGVIRALAERYPEAHVRLVETEADLGPNRKVCNLHGLAAAARHDLLLVSDSDMRVKPGYLRRVVAAFSDLGLGLITCPYRGAEAEGVPAALEALGIAAGFMPGVFVAALGGAGGGHFGVRELGRAFGQAACRREPHPGPSETVADAAGASSLGKSGSELPHSKVIAHGDGGRALSPTFAFGSTIALRRETLERIGGFAGLVDYLADDYQMGKRVTDLGLRVHLSSVVVDSVLGRRPFRETWARRLRWARTVRACRPVGHLGSGLTHTTALALLTALASLGCQRQGSGERWSVPALVATALVVRLAAAWRIAVVELESDSARRWFPLLFLSDLLEATLWASSLFGRTVLWRGQRYRLLEGGRIERE
jgi:ceramide glucosyltransferase